MDILFQSGKIVTGKETIEGDLAVTDGKITAIGRGLKPKPHTQVVDASAYYILPGAIDVHTHMELEAGGTITADDYEAGTRAAACGGVTTIFDYPTKLPDRTIVETIQERQRLCAPKACVDYAFHCAVTNMDKEEMLRQFKEAAAYGVTSFKCYMVYSKSGLRVSDEVLESVFRNARLAGAMVTVHAEDEEMIANNIRQFQLQGKTSPWYHYLSRPEEAEAKADKHVISLAAKADGPLYLVHMAAKEGLEAAIAAKKAGQEVYIETCPQYLAFTNEVYREKDGVRFICSPSIKGEESRQALWQAIKNGDIDTLATDHCPFMRAEKEWGASDFTKTPNGCAGVENMYPYLLAFANRGELTYQQVVTLCAANPARIFGCADKGELAVGKDADIVLYDPNKDFTITTQAMHSDYDDTIWEGIKLHGYPAATYVRGQKVYENGSFTGSPGYGRYIKRSPQKIKMGV